MSPARLQSCFAAWIVFLMVLFYSIPAIGIYTWAAIGLSAPPLLPR